MSDSKTSSNPREKFSARELKRLLRHAYQPAARSMKRKRGGGGNRDGGPEWTVAEMQLLGKMSDEETARVLRRSRQSVISKREKLRIPTFNPRFRAWTNEEDALLGTMSDEQLAKQLGRSVEAVRARRHLKRISLRRKWLPTEDRLLGTRPDDEIARRLQRKPSNVADRRLQLGIPSFEENQELLVAKKLESMSAATLARLLRKSHLLARVRHPAKNGRTRAPRWTEREDALLGKWPDERLARFLGRTRKGVEYRRLKLGIRYAEPGRRWNDEEEQLLNPAAKRSSLAKWTAQLAKQLKRSAVAVSSHRRLKYGVIRPHRRWTRRELRMLGRLPDAEVAALTGRRCGTVQVMRCALGIPSDRARNKFQWTPEKDHLLGTHSDQALAEKFGTYRKNVEARRRALGISVAAPRRGPRKPASEVGRVWRDGKRGWGLAEIELLGKIADAEAAKRLNRTLISVVKKRRSLGIPVSGNGRILVHDVPTFTSDDTISAQK